MKYASLVKEFALCMCNNMLHYKGCFLSDQHILSPINPNTTTDFVRFTQIVRSVNLCKYDKISHDNWVTAIRILEILLGIPTSPSFVKF